MEFGIMPIAYSHFILPMLTDFKITKEHDTPRDHALLNGAQKCRIYINNVAMLLFFFGGGGVLLIFFFYWFRMKGNIDPIERLLIIVLIFI